MDELIGFSDVNLTNDNANDNDVVMDELIGL